MSLHELKTNRFFSSMVKLEERSELVPAYPEYQLNGLVIDINKELYLDFQRQFNEYVREQSNYRKVFSENIDCERITLAARTSNF